MVDGIRPKPSSPCPCGRLEASGKPLAFVKCCSRYVDHFDDAAAPDAESLMRSRYTAFVLERLDYLLATWHPTHRPQDLSVRPAARWLGLDVKQHRLIDADHAEVEFVARHRSQGTSANTASGQAVRQHERSRFVRENGRWFYVDGDVQ